MSDVQCPMSTNYCPELGQIHPANFKQFSCQKGCSRYPFGFIDIFEREGIVDGEIVTQMVW